MDDYGIELRFESSQSRYADVRALREQRRLEREKGRRGSPQDARDKTRMGARAKAREDPYADIPPYENYTHDDFEREDPPRGSLARVVLTQALVCAVLLGGLFLAQKTMPNIYRQLKTAYAQMMRTDMSAREVWTAAARVIKNLREEVYVAAPYNGEPRTRESTMAEGTAEAAKPPTEPEDDLISETVEAMGGMDLSEAYAESKCSWAPLRTTVRAYPLVAEGRVTSAFGYRAHPTTGEDNIHTGLDIAADLGTPIHAAFYGVVAETGTGREYGNYIIIEHAGGLRTLYAHCDEVLAEEGMVLRAGDVIALVGSTGTSTGPHVHFEVRLNGMRCDPGEVSGIRN